LNGDDKLKPITTAFVVGLGSVLGAAFLFHAHPGALPAVFEIGFFGSWLVGLVGVH
jgi:hypothetical protein